TVRDNFDIAPSRPADHLRSATATRTGLIETHPPRSPTRTAPCAVLTHAHTHLLRTGLAEIHGPPVPTKI
ncbi:MAG: hypothetical protein ACRDQH_03210, partial [Pseudonocardiaceae bacterium]